MTTTMERLSLQLSPKERLVLRAAIEDGLDTSEVMRDAEKQAGRGFRPDSMPLTDREIYRHYWEALT